MNKLKREALSSLEKSAGERKKLKEQLAKMDREYNSTSKILEREACKELFSGFKALYTALMPGGSLHKLYSNIIDSTIEISGYNPNWRTEVLKPEPYGVKIDDEAVEYCRQFLVGILMPDTPLYVILNKAVASRRVKNSPFNEAKQEGKDVGKKK